MAPEPQVFYDNNLETIHISMWQSYPFRYKFHSIEFHADHNKTITHRYCYDGIGMISDIGGFSAVVL